MESATCEGRGEENAPEAQASFFASSKILSTLPLKNFVSVGSTALNACTVLIAPRRSSETETISPVAA